MRFLHFERAVVLRVEGRDAPRYANARLTNNAKLLPVDGGFLAAALNAQGKTLALFSVFRASDERFLLAADGGDPEAIRRAFSQFIVADRVVVDDVSTEYSLFHVIPNGASRPTETIAFDRRRGFEQGMDLIAPKGLLEEISPYAGAPRIPDGEYLLRRIKAGIPVFPEEINDSYLLSESGLREAIALNKGCYVGQEVVEKIDAVGKTARVVQRAVFPSAIHLEKGAPITDTSSGDSLGTILNAAIDPEENATWALLRVKNEASLADREVTCGDHRGKVIWNAYL